jgi:hypothetical protein
MSDQASHIQNKLDYISAYFNLYEFETADGNTEDTELQAFSEFNLFNCFMNAILICYCQPQTFEFCHIFIGLDRF